MLHTMYTHIATHSNNSYQVRIKKKRITKPPLKIKIKQLENKDLRIKLTFITKQEYS